MKKAIFILSCVILKAFFISCENSHDRIVGTWIKCDMGSAFCTITKHGKVFNLHYQNESDWVLEKKSEEIFTGANGMITVRYDKKSNHLFVSAAGEGTEELCKTEISPKTNKSIIIEPFTTAEENEYSDAGCWYSNTKGGKSIFLEAWTTDITVMKINHKIVKLKKVKEDEKDRDYVGDNFVVSIHIETVKPQEHVAEHKGYLIVKAKDGSSLKVEIWGGCGD